MSEPIVTLTGRGRIQGGEVTQDSELKAHCAACDVDVDLTVTMAGTPLCVDCLRRGLDAASVGRYRLTDTSRLPWGKVTS